MGTESMFNDSAEMTTNSPEPVWDCSGRRSPNSSELLKKLSNADASVLVPMCIAPILVFLMYVMYIDEMLFFKRDNVFWRRRLYYAWILGTFPVMSTMYVLTLYVPLASGVTSLFGSYYYGFVFNQFFYHVIDYYGGMQEMEDAMKAAPVVPPNPVPCCCVVCCFKNQPMTVFRLKRMEVLVNQVLYIFPVLLCFMTILTLEGHKTSIAGFLVIRFLEFLTLVSSFVAMYAFAFVSKSSKETLLQFNIRGKYVTVQLVAAVNTLQGFILGVLNLFRQLPCGFPYPDPKNAELLHAWILIVELFVLAVGAWFAYRRSEKGCEVVPIPQLEELHLTKITTKSSLALTFEEDNNKDAKLPLEELKRRDKEEGRSVCHINSSFNEVV